MLLLSVTLHQKIVYFRHKVEMFGNDVPNGTDCRIIQVRWRIYEVLNFVYTDDSYHRIFFYSSRNQLVTNSWKYFLRFTFARKLHAFARFCVALITTYFYKPISRCIYSVKVNSDDTCPSCDLSPRIQSNYLLITNIRYALRKNPISFT